MLHSLTHSKHKTISTCSQAALKNLLQARPSGMMDMVTKGASGGIPSLHARKRRNMVREMSDQLLESKVDVDDQDSDEVTDEDEVTKFEVQPRRSPMVNNYLDDKDEDDSEEIVDNPTDYSLQYQEEEEAEVNGANVQDEEAVKSFFTEGTPADTPRISKTNSVNDLVNNPEEELKDDQADQPQLYASEGTPGCFSRVDSAENINENETEKGQLETAENAPCEKENPKKVNFTQETPMMFSRSSSIESLNSFVHVQQPIQSGYSSYDISRVTSGRVSPSDLPDSPCQSPPMPARKLPSQAPKGFLKSLIETAEAVTTPTAASASVTAVSKNTENTVDNAHDIGDVNEEKVKTFDEEGTPAEVLSRKTSLEDITKVSF